MNPAVNKRLAGTLVNVVTKINRKVFPRLFSGFAPYYIVNEFPKSGGTWAGQLLADAIGVPFPRNKPIGTGPAICHGHFLYPYLLRNVLMVWRDPRDVLISYYHHCFFVNELGNDAFVARMRRVLPFADYRDVTSNLPVFVERVCTAPVFPRFTWGEFAERWAGREGVVAVRYEDLRHDTAGELQRITKEIANLEINAETAQRIAAAHDFAKARKRSREQREATPGAGISFVREGSVGGWRQHFGDDAHELVIRYCGSGMAKLGYFP